MIRVFTFRQTGTRKNPCTTVVGKLKERKYGCLKKKNKNVGSCTFYDT